MNRGILISQEKMNEILSKYPVQLPQLPILGKSESSDTVTLIATNISRTDPLNNQPYHTAIISDGQASTPVMLDTSLFTTMPNQCIVQLDKRNGISGIQKVSTIFPTDTRFIQQKWAELVIHCKSINEPWQNIANSIFTDHSDNVAMGFDYTPPFNLHGGWVYKSVRIIEFINHIEGLSKNGGGFIGNLLAFVNKIITDYITELYHHYMKSKNAQIHPRTAGVWLNLSRQISSYQSDPNLSKLKCAAVWHYGSVRMLMETYNSIPFNVDMNEIYEQLIEIKTNPENSLEGSILALIDSIDSYLIYKERS